LENQRHFALSKLAALQMMNECSLRAENKRKCDDSGGGDGGGGEQPLLSEQQQLLDASNGRMRQDALLAPPIASGDGGALVGGFGGSLSLSDKRTAETMAMAGEAAVQPDLTGTEQTEVEPAVNTSDETMAKQEKQKQKKARAEQREADNRQGQTDFKNVQAQLF